MRKIKTNKPKKIRRYMHIKLNHPKTQTKKDKKVYAYKIESPKNM